MAAKKSAAKTKSKKTSGGKAKSKTAGKSAAKSAGSETDIIKLILEDHKPVKELIEVLKDTDKEIEERRQAFNEFSPLLLQHATSEAKVLYTFMKDEDELREEGFEGDVEHGLAEQMLNEAKATDDEDLWSARVKVLAELVEHHIEEEEDELLPDFKKSSDVEMRAQMGEQYLMLKADFRMEDTDERQPEAAEADRTPMHN